MGQAGFNALYLLLGAGLTGYGVWMVLVTGRAFLEEAFQRNAGLVRTMSHVLAVSFSLLMLGYLMMAADLFTLGPNVALDKGLAWNQEFVHFGGLILFMGVDLFFHIFVLSQMRGRGRRRVEHGSSILA